LSNHQPVRWSFLAARVEERVVHPHFVDVAEIHALVLVEVDQLVIHLEWVHLVEIFDIESLTHH